MRGRIEVLGRISVDVEGPLIVAGLPGRRAELVFAYLAAEHHRVVTQDELADALWPDTLPDSWAAALRGVLTEVRRYLESAGLAPAEVLLTARRGYQLKLPPDVVVDLDEAREAHARARTLLDAGDGPGAIPYAARAAALARLPFLPNHDGEWVDGIRRELESLHIRALDIETRAHRVAGDLAAAATAAERLVRADPFNEAIHQLRIRILGEAGDRAGATRAYEHCRSTLATELGVEPSSETEAALQSAVQAAAPRAEVSGGLPSGLHALVPGPLADLAILVIEDHDFQRRTAVRLLRGLGVGEVAEAADGAAALEILANSPQPDVLICDIDMPGMDGVEFIRRVAVQGQASAVIIASGLDSKVLDAVRVIAEGQGLQLLGAVEKPLTPRRLSELLATYRRQPIQHSSASGVSLKAGDVATALAAGQITTLFEPIVDLAECRVTGAEAVGCWDHPDKGRIPSDAFLPSLTADGLLEAYAEAMLKDACAALVQLRSAGVHITAGIDVAPGVLADVTLADRILSTVRSSIADPCDIVCEVNEQILRAAPPAALDVMTRLRIKGFGLALDHYGTGGQRPERLAHIPFTQVKIDGSVVHGAVAAEEGRELLEEVFDVARSLGVPAVATGCESEVEFDLAAEMGFRYVQGRFVGPTMSVEELGDCARSWSPPAASPPCAQ